MKPYSCALIIDDDVDLCSLLKAILVKQVTDVLFVHSIANCREHINQMQPDVIFIDNNLPDGKGIAFIKELKMLRPGARIIAITAMPGLKKVAFENGADAFIEKPLSEANINRALGLQELP